MQICFINAQSDYSHHHHYLILLCLKLAVAACEPIRTLKTAGRYIEPNCDTLLQSEVPGACIVHKRIGTSGIPGVPIPNPGIEKPAPGLQSLVVT